MEMIYNELSIVPKSSNKILANLKVTQFIECYKTAKQHGFDRIRFSIHFHEIEISEGYTLQGWLEVTNQRNHKDLLLGARTYPFIRNEDIWAEDEYLKHHFYFENAETPEVRQECLGLASAHIYDTLSVSFSGSGCWERNVITLVKVNDKTSSPEPIEVTNVFSVDCFERKIIGDFVERIGEVVLAPSPLLPADKPINIRQDHGMEEIHAFSRRLRNSPYVNAIINSLHWNPFETNFIRKVYPNGMIEVVLYWTDEGLGLVLQTTGRNQRETDAIAKKLEEEYG